nr:tRNA preQ1(34) S-adenosylmethionine ribosyltransferase-isomerase QueA [bacterium]
MTKGLTLSDFQYDLPPELIAQTPIEPRDHARMLVVHRDSGLLEHRHFYDLPEYLHPQDCLARNESRVIPARLYATRQATGARVEFLLLRRIGGDEWETLCRPAKKARVGDTFDFTHGLTCRVTQEGEDGLRHIAFSYEGIFEQLLDKVGVMPLPPYIHAPLEDKQRYQTVYARVNGSAAAPTAGLHFTPELLSKIEGMGVATVPMLLHVGLGTFRPVAVENIDQHVMHREWYSLGEGAAARLNAVRQQGGRIIAVGTTSCRILETCADENNVLHAGTGETGIFIKPGYTFHGIDALITNFHLPGSTLLMLVSALLGRERTLEIYKIAVENRYRMFSFGDCMLIL